MKKKAFFTMLAVVLVLVLSLTVFVACNKDKKDNTDETAATLGENCGMSTGRNGVVENESGAEVFENHSMDTRYTGPVTVAQTVSAMYGMGGNNQPFVVEGETPKTLKIRAGCEGGGKGALVQDNKSATLSCNNDQTLFEPMSWNGEKVAPTLTKQNAGGNQRMLDKDNFNCVLEPFGISAKDSNAMRSANPKSGIYKATTARTLDGNGVALPCVYFVLSGIVWANGKD